MKRHFSILCCLLFTVGSAIPAVAEDIPIVVVDSKPKASAKDLIKESAIIAYGSLEAAKENRRIDKKVNGGELVNSVQTFRIKRLMKGKSNSVISVLSTSVEPLPDASSPLNNLYPGPLTQGDYVCFLKLVKGTDLYSIIGGWQGVYPLYEGKTVSLRGFGFPQFNSLTVDEMERKVKVE